MADEPFIHVTTMGRWSAARNFMSFETNQNATPVWPTANRAFYFPIVLPMSVTLRRFIIAWAGGAGGPNFDCGLYSDAGSLLANTGTLVRTSGFVHINPAGGTITVARGHYYMALVLSSVAADQEFGFSWATVGQARMAGTLQQDLGSASLPATMTPVTVASYLSITAIGLCQSATL